MASDAQHLHLSLAPDAVQVTIPWTDITSIVAFKQDLFKPHIIQLVIAMQAQTYEIGEADVGAIPAFIELLRQHLTGVVPFATWAPIVTDPLTYHQEVTIYRA